MKTFRSAVNPNVIIWFGMTCEEYLAAFRAYETFLVNRALCEETQEWSRDGTAKLIKRIKKGISKDYEEWCRKLEGGKLGGYTHLPTIPYDEKLMKETGRSLLPHSSIKLPPKEVTFTGIERARIKGRR